MDETLKANPAMASAAASAEAKSGERFLVADCQGDLVPFAAPAQSEFEAGLTKMAGR